MKKQEKSEIIKQQIYMQDEILQLEKDAKKAATTSCIFFILLIAALVFSLLPGCSKADKERASTALDIARRLHFEACGINKCLPEKYCEDELEKLASIEVTIENRLDKETQKQAIISDILPWLDWALSLAGIQIKKPP